MSNSTFDNIMQRLYKSTKNGLQPSDILKAALRTTLTGPGGVEAACETLLKVEKVSKMDCTDEIKVLVANEIVNGADLVDIYFSILPTPEQHESIVVGGFEAVHKAYLYAYAVLGTLIVAHGMGWVRERSQEDPILAYLSRCVTDTAAAISNGDRSYLGSGMYTYLLGLVWETGIAQKRTGISKYSRRTQNLLNYFGWVVLGRKDITCLVKKPFGRLRRIKPRIAPNEDLSRLPALERLPEDDAEKFSRLACLFQIAFNQFQRSTWYDTDYFVLLADGVVSVKTGMDGDRDRDFESLGAAQNLDLTRPVAQAVLHYCACSDPGHSANCLLEFFFRESCSAIDFVTFRLRNAETPMMVHNCSSMSFNMNPEHTIARLTTPEGFMFALDPSAPQYGWIEILAPYTTYAVCRIDHVTSIETRGPLAYAETPTRDMPMPEDEAEGREWTRRCIAEEIKELVEVFLKDHSGFEGVLEIPSSQFNDLCIAFEATLRSEMRPRDEERNPYLSSDSEVEWDWAKYPHLLCSDSEDE